jgi:hypothetical protein
MAWLNDGKLCTQLAIRWDGNGDGWIQAYATAGATKKTPVSIRYSQFGWSATAVADTSDVQMLQYIGVPKATYTSGVYGWFQVAGYASDVILTTCTGTIGQAVKLATDTVTTSGAASADNDNEWAIFTATDASAAAHNLMLFPVRIDGAD